MFKQLKMKKKILFFSLLFLGSIPCSLKAQQMMVQVVPAGTLAPEDNKIPPIRWSYSATKTSDTEAILTITVAMDKGWRIYAQKGDKDGPVNTTFVFNPSKDYELIGSIIAPAPVIRDDKFFLSKVSCFENTAVFKQKIKLNKGQTVVKGNLEYMGAVNNMCLPVKDVDFSIPVK